MRWIIWILISILILAAGVLLLRVTGASLIREITQDVSFGAESIPSASLEKAAPPFSLLDLALNTVSLSKLIGAPFILTFWTTWNPAATNQITILDEYESKHADKLFAIITLNSQQDKSVVSQFIKRGGYKIRVLMDENGSITDRYGARNLPVTYFIDADGIIRDIAIGVINEKELTEKSAHIISTSPSILK